MALGIAPLESREFLSSCLKAALEDPELVDAISDQALEQGFSALTIAKGQVSVEQLKDKLYLTVDEAKSVLNICSSMVAGVATPNKSLSNQEALSLQLQSTQSGGLALHVDYKQLENGAQSTHVHGTQEPEQASLPFEPLDMIMENAAVVVVSRATPHTSAKKILSAAAPMAEPVSGPGPFAPSPVPSVVPPAPAQPALADPEDGSMTDTALAPPAPQPAPHPQPEDITPRAAALKQTLPKPPAMKPGDASPSPKQSSASTAPSPAVSAIPKPSTATNVASVAKPADCKPSTTPSKKPADILSPEPSAVSPRIPSSPSSAPSYLKPTAAHKARISKEIDSSSNLPPVPENTHEQSKRRNLFARMASTFLAPTQAFVARVTGRHEEMKSKKEMAITKASLQLESVLTGPQGQRVTKPQPFILRSEMRGKSLVMSTEEIELAEAREKAFKKANPVPKHVYESRPIAPTQRSTPKDPSSVFEPFQLASLELHNKKMEERRKKVEEEVTREEEARRFKARSYDARTAASPITPPKPPPSPVTKPMAPVFASEARISHYHEVVEPAKKAREAEANRERLEEERKAKELEEMSLDDFRKTLEFKARVMPDFSSPFQVDRSLARPVTTPTEPKLHTVQRLGSPAARDDKEGPGLGKGVYDGAGYVDPFFASLRKSTSVNVARSGALPNPGAKSITPSSKRGSAVRHSAIASFGRNGGPSPAGATVLRGSLGNSLQAAIRAAAQDAARDLAANGVIVSSPVKEEDMSVSVN